MDAATSFKAAVAALQGGDLRRAKMLCDRVLQDQPVNPRVLQLAGIIACQNGQHEAGIRFFSKSLTADPNQGLSHYSRGCALYELDRHEQAIADFDAALRFAPELLQALMQRSNSLHKLGRLEEALTSIERLLTQNPQDAGGWFNRGNILRDLHRPEEALASYDRALGLGTVSAALLNNRGNVLRDLGHLDAAAEAFEQALRLAPELVEPLNNRGMVLLDLGRTREALLCFDEVLRRTPRSAEALDNRALALRMEDRVAEAAQAYAELLRVAPEFKGALANLHYARMLCCDWSHSPQEDVAVLEAIRGGKPANPMALLAVSDHAALQLQGARQFAAAEGWLQPFPPLWSGEPYGHDRIRVAYVSADFRRHAVSLLLVGVLEQHDRDRFEIIGIGLQPEDPSEFGQRVKASFDRFIDASRLNDRQIAALIRELEIDVAVDLMGCTRSCRPRIFAQRPAPVQVNYIGYPATAGMPFLDYIMADEVVIPRERAADYQEKAVYLPDCFQPNDDRRVIGPTPSRAEAGLPADGLVFCSFNNSYKLNPTMLDIWMRVLRQVPGSVLWLAIDSPVARENLRREAAAREVDPERIVLARRLDYPEHLGRLKLADLFLDTLPFNAGTTASDALWAGVPVLTCSGDAFAARMATSLLQAVGLPELITTHLADYEALALALATQPARLSELRARLAANRQTSPLFQTKRYCRNLEAAYTEMHARSARGERPAGFTIEAPSAG